MYCKHCGEEVAEGSDFCRHCGESLTDKGHGSESTTSPNNENADGEDDHPIAETWFGVVLLWSAFVVPPLLSPLFAVGGIGSFPPVRRWVASKAGDVPYAVEYALAFFYIIGFLVSLGAVWWTAYEGRPTVGEATFIAILMLGIMGVIAVIGVYLGRGFRSLT